MAKVEKIMLTDVPTLKKEAKVSEAAGLLAKAGSGCIVVVEGKTPVGIITELDIVRSVISKGKNTDTPVSGIMSYPVALMEPGMKLDEALKIIDTRKFRRYPVVEKGQLVGLATKRDIVNEISDNLKFHRNIQNTVLVLFVLFELFVFIFSKYLARLPFLR